MTQEIISVPPTSGFDIVLVQGPFDAGLVGLAKESVSLWDAEELAGLRALLGASHAVSTRWSWLAENFNYMNDADADILIASGVYNPLLKDPASAVQAHSEGKEVFLADGIVRDLRERARTDPVEARASGVYRLQRKDVQSKVPVTELDSYGPTRFLFGDQAKPYGAFLEAAGITSVPFYVVNADHARKQESPFARAFAVSHLLYRSRLSGLKSGLHYDIGRVGGVRPYAREAGAPKSSTGNEGSPLELKLAH